MVVVKTLHHYTKYTLIHEMRTIPSSHSKKILLETCATMTMPIHGKSHEAYS